MGTTSENAQNSINQLRLEIKGQTDKVNQYNYQDIQLLNNDEKVAKIEYIQNENTYGIRFSDLFKEYLLVKNENLNALLGVDSLPDKIDLNDFKNVFQFSKEEKQNMKNKYISIINTNIAKESFSKQKDQTIEIDRKKVNVNAYTLTLTKEQMNQLYIKILEEVKQDEIILSKLDALQAVFAKYQMEKIANPRESFVKSIDEMIESINKNNIGQEESKIIVYENYHNTVRTVIQNPEYEITIDVLSLTTDNHIQVNYRDIANKKEQQLTYKKEEETTTIDLKNLEGQKTVEYSLVTNQKVEGNSCDKNIVAKFEDNSNKVEANIEQKINLVDSFDDQVVPSQENAINLSELGEEQLQSIMEQVTTVLSEKINELTTTVISVEDLVNVLKTIRVIPDEFVIEGNGVTEIERNRFNSRFEILKGENLENETILKLIDAIKDNFADIEIASNTELRLKIERFNKNEEAVTKLSNFIEENRNKKYNVTIEYDEETGLVNAILLTILER